MTLILYNMTYISAGQSSLWIVYYPRMVICNQEIQWYIQEL